MPNPAPSTRDGVRRTQDALRRRLDQRTGTPQTRNRPLAPREQALNAALRAMETINPHRR